MSDTHLTHDFPASADRTHVPDMESFAYNQMPKVGVRDPRLFRYDGTDLYQWYAKAKDSIFEDPCDEPFVIRPHNAPDLEALVREWVAERNTFIAGETTTLREISDRMAAAVGLSIGNAGFKA
ncbi:hypothetical protein PAPPERLAPAPP_02010 [Brevundimonas phage vB_BpoS-Papperlapapp]|nr:hypothetical protein PAPPERLAPAPP_02010 [Brevundimonas phage vB_BpoS-Papperlapapp]